MLKIRKKLAEKKEASKGIAKAGFTLIELLVVLVILGILVLIAAPRFLGYSKDANVTAMQADAKVLANAALIYNVENDDTWPVVEGEETDEVNGVAVKDLNPAAFKDTVQSLKGDFGDYALVVEEETKAGDNGVTYQKGDIVHKTGIADKEGTVHFGVEETP